MRNRMLSIAGLGLVLQGSACVLLIREPEFYQEDVVELVESNEQKDALTACYETYLDARSVAVQAEQREENGLYTDIAPAVGKTLEAEDAGLVVLSFKVAAKTGKLEKPEVDTTRTTAPTEVADCVVSAIEGLELEEPDQYDGEITLAWKFSVGKPRKASPPAPASPGPRASAP